LKNVCPDIRDMDPVIMITAAAMPQIQATTLKNFMMIRIRFIT
jgi:hypothetical protein